MRRASTSAMRATSTRSSACSPASRRAVRCTVANASATCPISSLVAAMLRVTAAADALEPADVGAGHDRGVERRLAHRGDPLELRLALLARPVDEGDRGEVAGQ